MPEAFEYAIKKKVRNNPILREIDEARHRSLWKTVAVAGLLVGTLLLWAGPQVELFRHGYRFEELQRDIAIEEEAGRRLRLEIETLRSPKRIEAIAIDELHMVAPTHGEAIVLERVVPANPPAKSVVARR